MGSPATSSGLITSATQVSLLSCRLQSLQVNTDGTNPATVIVYDSENSTTSGKTILAKAIVPGLQGGEFRHFNDDGIYASRGLYVTISGTGAEAIVAYAPS